MKKKKMLKEIMGSGFYFVNLLNKKICPPPFLTPCIVIFWLEIGAVFVDKGARD